MQVGNGTSLFANDVSPFLTVIECITHRWYNSSSRISKHYTGDKTFLIDLTVLIATLTFPQHIVIDFVPFRLSDVTNFWRRWNLSQEQETFQKMTLLSNGETLLADDCGEEEEKVIFHLHRPAHSSNVQILVVTDHDLEQPQQLLQIDCNGFSFNKNHVNFSKLLRLVKWKEFDTETNFEFGEVELDRRHLQQLISDFYAITECTIECTLNFKHQSLKVENESMGTGFLIYGFPLDLLRRCHFKVDLGKYPRHSSYLYWRYRDDLYATVDIHTASNHFRVETVTVEKKQT